MDPNAMQCMTRKKNCGSKKCVIACNNRSSTYSAMLCYVMCRNDYPYFTSNNLQFTIHPSKPNQTTLMLVCVSQGRRK